MDCRPDGSKCHTDRLGKGLLANLVASSTPNMASEGSQQFERNSMCVVGKVGIEARKVEIDEVGPSRPIMAPFGVGCFHHSILDVSVSIKEKTSDMIFAKRWHKVQEQPCGNLEVKNRRGVHRRVGGVLARGNISHVNIEYARGRRETSGGGP